MKQIVGNITRQLIASGNGSILDPKIPFKKTPRSPSRSEELEAGLRNLDLGHTLKHVEETQEFGLGEGVGRTYGQKVNGCGYDITNEMGDKYIHMCVHKQSYSCKEVCQIGSAFQHRQHDFLQGKAMCK